MAKKKKIIQKNKTISENKIPKSVKLISVLFYISAAFGIIFSTIAIIGGIFLIKNPILAEDLPQEIIQQADEQFLNILSYVGHVFVLAGIIMLAIAIIYFILANKINKGKNWARTVSIIISILFLLVSFMILLSGNIFTIFGIIIHGLISYYLLFDKKTIDFFKK